MSYIEELRLELKTIQSMLDEAKEALSQANEIHNELNDYDPEYNATFALMNAEADYYVDTVERKIKLLEFKIETLESQDLDN